MATLKKEDIGAILSVPTSLRDRMVVRCTEAKAGPSSKGKPMITARWELVGKPAEDQTTEPPITKIERGGQVYEIGGLKTKATYFTLTAGGALARYIEFWEKANNATFTEVDPENPNIEYMNGLLMEALVSSREAYELQTFTEEEKQALLDAGKSPYDQYVLDKDGNKIPRNDLNIDQFLCKYEGAMQAY